MVGGLPSRLVEKPASLATVTDRVGFFGRIGCPDGLVDRSHDYGLRRRVDPRPDRIGLGRIDCG